MKKKRLLFIPLIALFLTGCNPLDSVKGFWTSVVEFVTGKKKQEEPEEQTPTPEPQQEEPQEQEPEEPKEPTEPVEPVEPIEPQPQEPVPFTFDQFEYKLKSGVSRSDIEGNPWINSNLEGQLNKIEKPSLKDDFYASINYDEILNGGKGIFDNCDDAVESAFDNVYEEDSKAVNSALFRKMKDGIKNGNCEEIATYFADFDYSSFVSSESLFTSKHSFFSLEKDEEENKYYVMFNDGLYIGETSFATLGVYTQYATERDKIISELSDAFNLSYTTADISNINNFNYDTCEKSYESYAYFGGYRFSKFIFNNTNTKYLDAALTDAGLSSTDNIYILDASVEALKQFKNYSEDTIKKALISKLAFELRFLSGLDHYRPISGYLEVTKEYRLFEDINLTNETDENAVKIMTRLSMPEAFEKAYIDVACDSTTKAKVLSVIEEIISAYKLTAETYDWLDEETKEGVYKKLDKMKYDACYSEKIKAYPKIDETNIDLLSLLEIYGRYQSWLYNLKFDQKLETSSDWSYYPTYTVNAFYNPGTNSFVILNGLVGGISFDWSKEQILGSLGMVIGHEISHSIDSSGSRFDENGNWSNWWSAESKTEFNKKVNNMIDFYDQIGVSKTLFVNGDNVNGEATADMGGVHVCLEIAKTIENFNYDLFFKTYANLWLQSPYPKEKLENRNQDEHPFPYLRVNVTLAQFDEFFETYKIGYGDKMYIPEDQRITIW